MPRKKPTHGGARPNAGRPTTTGMASTPPIHFRLAASTYGALKAYGKRQGLSPHLTAKHIVELYLATPRDALAAVGLACPF